VKTRVLSFGSLASTLARNEAQSIIDRIQERLPRLTCQLSLLPSPVADADKENEPFLSACRAEVEHLEEAVRREQVRLTVLEASDMVLPLPEDLAVVCVPDRATPFDAFLNRKGLIMDEMPAGSRIGVLSIRSRTQMQALWPELNFVILRGGVERAMETHMRRDGIDGLVMPASVTEDLGIQGIVAEIFSPEFILPGPGQGTRAIVGRANDQEARDLLTDLHSPASAAELTAEHAFCRRMISDQDLPVGALARVRGDQISIVGATGSGSNRIAVDGPLSEAGNVGDGLATQMLSSVDTFADLLEADFPDGLPDEDEDAAELALVGNENDAEEADESDDLDDLDDLERLRTLEDMAGIEPPKDPDDDDPDEDL
jgi:hydroxymethylbilane synthase